MSHFSVYSARVVRAILLGLPGIILLPIIVTAPEGVPTDAIIINPLLLLVLAAVGGAWAAPKADLASALILGSPARRQALLVCGMAGLAAGIAVALIDHAMAPLWNARDGSTFRQARDAGFLALGMIYGGITEEVLFRWGLMSLLALALMRLLPRPVALWVAATLAALAFALAHLPAVALEAGAITPALMARTLIWNGLLGLAYGSIFMRHGLEAAILAHMGTHLGFAFAAI